MVNESGTICFPLFYGQSIGKHNICSKHKTFEFLPQPSISFLNKNTHRCMPLGITTNQLILSKYISLHQDITCSIFQKAVEQNWMK